MAVSIYSDKSKTLLIIRRRIVGWAMVPWIRPFQENKSPKNGEFSERKASGLGGFNFWNYLNVYIDPL
jgi:hypothetical protein